MRELNFIINKFSLDINKRSPIEIPNIGRNNLGELFKELGYKVGVELGVEQGIFSEILCNGNPDMHLYGIDAWKAYRGYRDHVSQDKLDKFYNATTERMSKRNFTAIRSYSMDALSCFDDNSIDFIYIDANHDILHVIEDIYHWSKKVRIGGMISGHDYRENKRFVTTNHTVYAVNAYTKSYRISPWFLLGTKEVIPGEIRDKARSWFWIKDR